MAETQNVTINSDPTPPSPPPPPPTPGWKTSEAWLSFIAMVVGAFMASGLFPSDSTAMRVAGMAATVLAAFGYSYSRGMVKAAYHGATSILLIGFLLFGTSSCACKDSNSVACVVVHAVVDCSEGTVVSQAPGFLPFVAQLINMIIGSGGTLDTSSLETALAGFGLKDAVCIATEIEADLATPAPTATPARLQAATAYRSWYAGWVAKKLPAGTKVKLADGRML